MDVIRGYNRVKMQCQWQGMKSYCYKSPTNFGSQDMSGSGFNPEGRPIWAICRVYDLGQNQEQTFLSLIASHMSGSGRLLLPEVCRLDNKSASCVNYQSLEVDICTTLHPGWTSSRQYVLWKCWNAKFCIKIKKTHGIVKHLQYWSMVTCPYGVSVILLPSY